MDLYLVKYDRFFAYEDGEDSNGEARLGVMRDTSCQAILRKDPDWEVSRHIGFDYCLRHGKLPTDTSHLVLYKYVTIWKMWFRSGSEVN